MKIDNKDLFHGAALTQIVEHPSFKALNKADAKYGHYQVNADRRLLVKHSEKTGTSWQFTFAVDDLSTLQSDISSAFTTFVVLVCSKQTICVLTKVQFSQLIDLSSTAQQWIRVNIPKVGASMHITGSQANLKNTVAHNSFPANVFA